MSGVNQHSMNVAGNYLIRPTLFQLEWSVRVQFYMVHKEINKLQIPGKVDKVSCIQNVRSAWNGKQ